MKWTLRLRRVCSASAAARMVCLSEHPDSDAHCEDTLDSSSVNTARFQPPATAATSPHTAANESQSAGMARFPVSWIK